jgi:hypothetical protein
MNTENVKMAGPASMGAVVTLPLNSAPDEIIVSSEFRNRVKVSRRTEYEWRERGLLPYIKMPDSRLILYHWPSVLGALLRMQSGRAS